MRRGRRTDGTAPAVRPAPAESGGVVTALLEAPGLTKRFGGVTAVADCSFAVPAGTVTALIGPNGSGKTTVFNLVTGYLRADAGDGRLRRATRPPARTPPALYRRGLTRTFQQARVFRKLTLIENLVGGDQPALERAVPPRRRHGPTARAPRRSWREFGLRRSRRQPGERAVVRPAEAPGVRDRADGPPPARAAGRAHLRGQPGDGRAHGAPHPRPARARDHVPGRRARHEPRHAPVRPGDRAGSRHEARRGRRRGRPARTPTSSTRTWGPDGVVPARHRGARRRLRPGRRAARRRPAGRGGPHHVPDRPQRRGQVHGPKTISGLLRPTEGSILFGGQADRRPLAAGDPRAAASSTCRRSGAFSPRCRCGTTC